MTGGQTPMHPLPVSLYFMPEWWDRHYHVDKPRASEPSQNALESLYLGRLRFLYEQFGQWEIGQDNPKLEGGQIATVLRHGYDTVPVLLGTTLDYGNAWGFFPRFHTLGELGGLEPVDIANHPEGEWLVREKQRLDSLYGRCTHCLDLGSVVNHAFRIVGQDIYADMIGNPEEVKRLFECILQTMRRLFDFMDDVFGEMDPVPFSNCNVTLMGPALYEDLVLPFDARQNRFAAERHGVVPRAAIHHCDVPLDPFVEAYAKLPGLASVQASFTSDVAKAKKGLGGCDFSAMVSPRSLNADLAAFEASLQEAIADGTDDLAIWNVDPETGPDRLRTILGIVDTVCRRHGREPRFEPMPLCWEEMQWAHRQYQGG
jgi:hypothetical protein